MADINPRLSVAEFLGDKINESGKTQREVADEAGFVNPNVMTMFKTGATKLPLDRIGPLAKALNIDSAHLLRIVMLEYAPDTWEQIENNLKSVVLAANEVALIRSYRKVNGGRDSKVRVVANDAGMSLVADETVR